MWQKTCLLYLPIKSVVKNMSVSALHHGICQEKLWVNTIVQSELLYSIDIFYSFEITIKTYGVLRYKKGQVFPIDFTVF